MELRCNRFPAEFCENHQGFRYSNENCMLQGFYPLLCSLNLYTFCMYADFVVLYCTLLKERLKRFLLKNTATLNSTLSTS